MTEDAERRHLRVVDAFVEAARSKGLTVRKLEHDGLRQYQVTTAEGERFSLLFADEDGTWKFVAGQAGDLPLRRLAQVVDALAGKRHE